MRFSPRWPAVVLAISGLACHRGASQFAMPSGEREGQYEFEALLDRSQIRGTMIVTRDTILFEPQTESCRPSAGPSDFIVYKYDCFGTADFQSFTVRIDRHSPVTRSSWSGKTMVRKQRRVCVEYRADSRGNRVCARYETEYYDEAETRSGPLRVRRSPMPG